LMLTQPSVLLIEQSVLLSSWVADSCASLIINTSAHKPSPCGIWGPSSVSLETWFSRPTRPNMVLAPYAPKQGPRWSSDLHTQPDSLDEISITQSQRFEATSAYIPSVSWPLLRIDCLLLYILYSHATFVYKGLTARLWMHPTFTLHKPPRHTSTFAHCQLKYSLPFANVTTY
jgi:hypothetical protein